MSRKKQFLLGVLLTLTSINSYSQDLIIKRDSSRIYCIILKEDSLTISFRALKDKQRLEQTINKTDVLKCFNSGTIAKEKKIRADTAQRIWQAKELKKGFYKSYGEFIINSPSIIKDLTVKERHALIITRGSPYDYYVTNGSVNDDDVYGFCDGKDIYFSGLRGNGYCKLEYLGPYPFFTYVQHGIGIANTITPNHLLIIDENGIYQDGTVRFVKKLIKSKNIELALEYGKLDWITAKEKREEYLIKLNEFLKKKK